MLLALDIGNTSTTFGMFKGPALYHSGRVLTSNLLIYLKKKKLFFKKCDQGVIASVVPPLDRKLKIFFRGELLIRKPLFVGSRCRLPIDLRVDRPSEVGADRIANNVGAYLTYGASALVVDFGTATTLDYVDKEGAYRGGVIAPGMAIGAEALLSCASKLNKSLFQIPRVGMGNLSPLGKNTKDQVYAGVIMGHAAMVDGLIERVFRWLGHRPKIIATGGFSSVIAPMTEHIRVVDPHLTLKGLCAIHAFQ